jgi:hypothetical protein
LKGNWSDMVFAEFFFRGIFRPRWYNNFEDRSDALKLINKFAGLIGF